MRTKILTKRGWAFRGRPRDRFHSYADTKLLAYLAEVSVKYGIDSSEFFGKFVEAWGNRESTCGTLKIECRRRTRDSAIFLITSDYRVVAQFSIPESLLRESDPLKEIGYILEHGRHVLVKDREAPESICLRIRDLKAGMKRVSLKARVVEISEPRLALTRFNDYVMFANAVLSDETSTIRLTLWNNRTKMVSVNDVVQIENVDVVVFREERQLRMGKNGRLRVLDKNEMTDAKG